MLEHPFIQNAKTGLRTLPPQLIKSSEKDEDWYKANLDALEHIARGQWLSNRKLIDDYKIANGELVITDIIGDTEILNDFEEPIKQISKDFDIPTWIKHYDIVSVPLNRFVGEMDNQPDSFTVVGKGDSVEGELMRMKTDLLMESVLSDIEKEVRFKLIEKGLDPNFNDFQSEEEKQSYIQTLQAETDKIKSPMEIQEWSEKTYKHIAVQWGEIELEDQKERFSLSNLRRVEFKDLLSVGRRFRYIYLTADGFNVESLNPVDVFYHKSPSVKYIQDGDYVGTVKILSISEIINRYGFLMSANQLESLQRNYKDYKDNDQAIYNKTLDGKKVNHLSPLGIPYGTRVPTLDRNINELMNNNQSINSMFVDESLLNSLNGTDSIIGALDEMYQVTECFWKSGKRIGKLVFINEEGVLEKVLVDDSYVVPDYIKEIKDGTIEFKEEDEINTLTWTYTYEILTGIKISNAGMSGLLKEPLYLNMKKHDIQFKSELLIYNAKLPIAGQVINNRNSTSKGLVALLRPYIFFHNVLMNQAYQFLEKEIIPFILMDISIIPNDKDWGTTKNSKQNNIDKWLNVAKAWGIVPADTSPSNTEGGNPNNQLPKVIDLTMAERMLTRFKMAQQIKSLAYEQLGISPQWLGDVKSTETATGINAAVQNTALSTSFWFTEFFACEKEILTMQLMVAQTLQSKNKDITASASKSDLTNKFIQFTNNDFLLPDLHVYLSNSQKTLRDLETVKRLGLENNTLLTKISDRVEMVTANSVPSILNIIKNTEKELEEKQNRDYELQQQQLEQEKSLKELEIQKQEEMFYARLENDLQREYIRASGYNENLDKDINTNTIPDVLEQMKLLQNQDQNNSKIEIERQKLQNDYLQQDRKFNIEERKLTLEQIKEANKIKLEAEKLKRAKVQGDKSK